jgi:hypothetical protein
LLQPLLEDAQARAVTLWDQLSVLGRRLESASRALLARVLAQPVVGLDQTSWPRLDGKGDKPWQMWCLTAPKAVVHRIRDDKGADTFKSLMSGYKGVIVCDALKTHEAGARGNDAIALAGCWAHYPEWPTIQTRCLVPWESGFKAPAAFWIKSTRSTER